MSRGRWRLRSTPRWAGTIVLYVICAIYPQVSILDTPFLSIIQKFFRAYCEYYHHYRAGHILDSSSLSGLQHGIEQTCNEQWMQLEIHESLNITTAIIYSLPTISKSPDQREGYRAQLPLTTGGAIASKMLFLANPLGRSLDALHIIIVLGGIHSLH
jgi:hypothetical protein